MLEIRAKMKNSAKCTIYHLAKPFVKTKSQIQHSCNIFYTIIIMYVEVLVIYEIIVEAMLCEAVIV